MIFGLGGTFFVSFGFWAPDSSAALQGIFNEGLRKVLLLLKDGII
jgi:hypothetical protein